MPFSTPGMNSFGTEPPTTFDLEYEAVARLACGSTTILTWRELAGAAGLLLVRVIDLDLLA